MKNLVSTKNTKINVDEFGNLYCFEFPLGITIGNLKAYKSNGFNFDFPFIKINLDEIEPDFEFPNTHFVRKGYLRRYRGLGIDDFREEYKISNHLSIGAFYDVNSLSEKSRALIFTFHNEMNFTGEIEGSFENFKKEEESKNLEKRIKKEKFYEEMNIPCKGWYVVTIQGMAFKNKGNDGKATASVRVLADSKLNAYDIATDHLMSNPKGNVQNWMSFEEPEQALIEYVGVWNDEHTEVYGN